MGAALDHVFICCSIGGPEAELLARLGLKEGTGNAHAGQGTACRRFFFRNAYLELLWVADPQEAWDEASRPTRLWERWAQRRGGACPFGIVLRAGAHETDPTPPFESWSYRPAYLPGGLSIEIARETPLTEPVFSYLGFMRERAGAGREPIRHDLPIEALTGVTVCRPAAALSAAARALQAAGLVAFRDGDDFLMELDFDDARRGSADLRPALPLTLRW